MPVNTLRSKLNGRHFPDDIFERIFVNENEWILIKISLKFVPRGLINNIPALIPLGAGGNAISEPINIGWPWLSTHTCKSVARPLWVNFLCVYEAPVSRLACLWETLIRVMAWCRTYDKPLPEHIMVIFCQFHPWKQTLHWDLNQNTYTICIENAFQYVACKMAIISFQIQCSAKSLIPHTLKRVPL